MAEGRRIARLSQRVVDAAEPEAARYYLWDADLKGFGLRVDPGGLKTFVVRYRAGGSRTGAVRQAKLGAHGKVTLDEARSSAGRICAAAAMGADPAAGKARQAGVTPASVDSGHSRLEPSYNLVIVHTADGQDISDWVTVSGMIHERAPDIEVRIVNNRAANSATRKWQVRRPSLVFSPFHLITFRPTGGKVYAGRRYSKLEQYERLKAAGIPVPLTAELTANVELDPGIWGDHVIVKPSRGSFGEGVRLIRTSEVASRLPELLRGQRHPLLVQQFIDTGSRPFQYRVLTLFGRPLYAQAIYAREVSGADVPLAPSGSYELTSSRSRSSHFIDDHDVLDLAARTYAAMPEVPVHGVDILRDGSSGKLHVLETNPGGNVWHLSSPVGKKAQELLNMNYYDQFDPLEIVADELIRRTRAEAQ